MSKMKPMMRQYIEIKEEYKDSILLFHLGNFYEVFNQDAYIMHKVLGLKITARNVGMQEYIPMCGIPIAQVDKYRKQLLKKGYAVAMCNQVQGESEIQEVVNRKVVKQEIPEVNKYCGFHKEYEEYLIRFKEDTVNKRNTNVDTIVINELEKLVIDEITPQQALTLLYKWKDKVSSI